VALLPEEDRVLRGVRAVADEARPRCDDAETLQPVALLVPEGDPLVGPEERNAQQEGQDAADWEQLDRGADVCLGEEEGGAPDQEHLAGEGLARRPAGPVRAVGRIGAGLETGLLGSPNVDGDDLRLRPARPRGTYEVSGASGWLDDGRRVAQLGQVVAEPFT